MANPNYDSSQPTADCVEFLTVVPQYSCSKEMSDQGTEWIVSLEISQTIPEGANLPYAFTLRIQGTVAVSPHLSGSLLQRSIHANGPAMLFGAAREIIRAATGRGPWAAVIIPSTNFLANLPTLPAAPSSAPEISSTKKNKPVPAKKTAKVAKPTKAAKSKKS